MDIKDLELASTLFKQKNLLESSDRFLKERLENAKKNTQSLKYREVEWIIKDLFVTYGDSIGAVILDMIQIELDEIEEEVEKL